MTESLRIVRLEAENVKRLVAVSVEPSGALVLVGGRNGAGKSSVLDSIAFALGGQALVCEQPLREGAEKGHVEVDLGELVVRREFTRSGTSRLTVTSREGARFPSPQAMLDRLIGPLSFDPLAFARCHPREQAETLRGLVGLDFSAQDGLRRAAYEERTAVNRDVKRLGAQLAGMPYHADAPEREVDVSALMDELAECESASRACADFEQKAEALDGEARRFADLSDRCRRELEDMREAIAALESEGREYEANRLAAEREAAEIRARVAIDRGRLPDPAPIREAIAAAGARNRKLAENAARERLAAELAEQQARSGELTREIEAIDAAKAQAIAAAKFPVDGLSFDAEQVLYRGIPFSQASSAEQIRISMAMAFAMQPRLRIALVRDASLLDDESLDLVARMAEESGAQAWLEVVRTDAGCSVVIEDGVVRVEEEPA